MGETDEEEGVDVEEVGGATLDGREVLVGGERERGEER